MRLIRKPILFMLTGALIAGGCTTQKNYHIQGEVAGQAEGYKVYLQDRDFVKEYPLVDSTVIENGHFEFTGQVDEVAEYAIIIDTTPAGEDPSQKNWLSSPFYLENADIQFAGHIDSLPTYMYNRTRPRKKAVITGSKSQDILEEFSATIADLRAESQRLDSSYLQDYHLPALDGVFHTERGIELIQKQEAVHKKIKKATWDFYRAHPESPVVYDRAMYNFMGMYMELTEEEIDDLVSIIEQGWKDTPKMDAFKKAAEKAKRTAVGTLYQDFELLTPEGESVMLSDYIQEGEYVMLEFWASWCGPCRGEIPHLRDVYENYKDKGFKIISISIDEQDKDWKQAMKEEKMVWTQLNDPKGFQGEISQAYNILGIPYALLLDKEGRIFKFGMRGATLDAALQELYGNP